MKLLLYFYYKNTPPKERDIIAIINNILAIATSIKYITPILKYWLYQVLFLKKSHNN